MHVRPERYNLRKTNPSLERKTYDETSVYSDENDGDTIEDPPTKGPIGGAVVVKQEPQELDISHQSSLEYSISHSSFGNAMNVPNSIMMMVTQNEENLSLDLKPFLCNGCEWSFTDIKSLQVHMGLHTGERPFMCHQCGLSFANMQFLDKHSQVHKMPYACPICGKNFSSKYTIPKHIRLMHTEKGVRPFPCEVCDKRFTQRHHLRDHMLSHTGEFAGHTALIS